MKSEVVKKPVSETEALFRLDKPSLENLSYALRHPDMWPKRFVWDYDDCDACAMGLAVELWHSIDHVAVEQESNLGDEEWRKYLAVIAREFSIPWSEAREIFIRAHWSRGLTTEVTTGWLFKKTSRVTREMNAKDVTPEMVADDIDDYLRRAAS